METVDQVSVRAASERVFAIAVDVEKWPEFLDHYRWVHVLERSSDGCLVEMAAWRPFGPLRYPTWWQSRMRVDREESVIRYEHVRGVTRGMDVEWKLDAHNDEVRITITHRWTGLPVPLLGAAVANWVIGPVFIHGIASRTLLGIKRKAELR